jgi:hypothetical protein
MLEKREFVQFIHPGGEHEPDADGQKSWNVGPHRRKFLTAPGRYIRDGQTEDGNLVFWGEWEAQSRIVNEYNGQVSDGPHFLHEPYYDPPTTWAGNWRQNTDPFVFGDQFHYTGCLQHTKRGPTQLRFLARGSILLFGSCRERSRFVVDTVFVVDRWIDHGVTDFEEKLLQGAVSDAYASVTIGPWYSAHMPEDRSHRLYFGASPDRMVDGMYSFFPCLPAPTAPDGFPRPTIRLPGQITQQLLQGKKMTAISKPDEARALWGEVAEQVHSQRLMLGVNAELPSRRKEVNAH